MKRENLTMVMPIRWTESQGDLISREAWKRRKSASGFMREIVTDYLRKEGVELPDECEHWWKQYEGGSDEQN